MASSNFWNELEALKNGTGGTSAKDDACNAVAGCGMPWALVKLTKSRLLAEHSSKTTISECMSSVMETAKKSSTSARLTALHSWRECREERRR